MEDGVRLCWTGQKLPWDGPNHQKGIDKSLNHVSREQNGTNYASRKTIRDQDPLARWLLF